MDSNTNKLIFPLCFLFLLVCIPIKMLPSDSNVEDFNAYLSRYNKSYNETEYQKRFELFVTSKKMIEKLNAQRNSPDSAYYGVTKYADLLPIEFLVSNLIKKGDQPNFKDWLEKHKKEIPLKIDWREKDVLSPVYNQKSCGGCWAFTTIETVESLKAIENGKLDKLSIQQMIDCSLKNNGCKGGDMCVLLDEMVQTKLKIVKDIEYPLNLNGGDCKSTNSSNDGVIVKRFKCEYLGNHEDVILHYLANVGPVSAAVNAGSWQHYLGGIIQFHCDSSPFHMNHAVQIVGYDISGPIPFYIVRNSWGTDFGENGYLKIAIGKNMCGIANKVVSIFI